MIFMGSITQKGGLSNSKTIDEIFLKYFFTNKSNFSLQIQGLQGASMVHYTI